jgi:hypothetical protein
MQTDDVALQFSCAKICHAAVLKVVAARNEGSTVVA